MTVQTEKYTRKPFHVQAVQVTAENIDEVAEWCGGEVVGLDPAKVRIIVPVKLPLNERQKYATVGDWILFANNGFKVYLDQAFRKSFDKVQIVHRDAGDGQFVTAAEAEANPTTTTKETV